LAFFSVSAIRAALVNTSCILIFSSAEHSITSCADTCVPTFLPSSKLKYFIRKFCLFQKGFQNDVFQKIRGEGVAKPKMKSKTSIGKSGSSSTPSRIRTILDKELGKTCRKLEPVQKLTVTIPSGYGKAKGKNFTCNVFTISTHFIPAVS